MKMLVIQGYFEEGKFITDTPVAIPEKRKTIVTVLDEEALSIEARRNERIEKWEEFRLAIENDKEELPDDFPVRMGNFRTPEELNLRD
jgi:hypothetical protein